MNKTLLVVLGACLVVVVAGVAYLKDQKPVPPPVPETTPVTLGLSWIHQAQFTGEYYADQKGLYTQNGLKTTLVPGELGKDPLQRFLNGEFDYVIAQPDTLIKARLKGAKIKAIAATYRIHPLVFAFFPEQNVRHPEDLRGKTVGVAYSEIYILQALLRKTGVPEAEVSITTRNYDFKGLSSGTLQVQGAWITDEAQTARRNGIQYETLLPSDYGIIFYADVLVASEERIQNQPDEVERFLKATLEGWKIALANVDTHSQLTLQYNETLNPQHEVDVLTASRPLIHTGKDQIGWMHQADWEAMAETILTGTGDSVNVDDLFTMQFLKAIYQDSQ